MKKTLSVLLSVAATTAMACDPAGMSGFAPENDQYISTMSALSNMTEADFNGVIEKFESVYSPIISAMGERLVVNRRWTDGTVNAYADRKGGTFNVTMFGGLARHQFMSKEGFAMVLCHEVGHHVGGAPKIESYFGPSWASNEGQADYFAGAKCMRKFLDGDNNREIADTLTLPESVKLNCYASFTSDDDRAICERVAHAGFDLALVLNNLRSGSTNPDFDTPDSSVVSKTDDAHPAAQCRLDSYYQGAICEVSHTADPDQRDAERNYCTRAQHFDAGLRPLCWYKPN